MRTYLDGRDGGGRRRSTQRIKKTSIFWDELNTSFISKSKPINSFIFVSFYRD